MQSRQHQTLTAKELFEQGKALYECDQLGSALNQFQKAQKNDPLLPNLSLYTGMTYMKLGRTREAIRCFHVELELHSDNPEAYYELAYAYLEAEDPDNLAAQNVIFQGIEKNPTSSRLHFMLGLCYERLSSPALAEQAYVEATKLDATCAPALMNLGGLAIQDQRWSDAYNFYAQALQVEPQCPDLLENIALVCEYLGLWDEERAFLAQLFLLKPNSKFFGPEEWVWKN